MVSSRRFVSVQRHGMSWMPSCRVFSVTPMDALTTPERLNLLERLERETRRLRAPGHELINQLAEQAGPDELGGRLSHALADRLRITRGEARRRGARAPRPGRRG